MYVYVYACEQVELVVVVFERAALGGVGVGRKAEYLLVLHVREEVEARIREHKSSSVDKHDLSPECQQLVKHLSS